MLKKTMMSLVKKGLVVSLFFLCLSKVGLIPVSLHIPSASRNVAVTSEPDEFSDFSNNESIEQYCARFNMKPTKREVTCLAYSPECMCDPI